MKALLTVLSIGRKLLMIGLFLWVVSYLFPETVQIDSIKALILATILIWVLYFAIARFVIVILLACNIRSCTHIFILSLICALLSGVIIISLLSFWPDGFIVVGLWPKVLLSLCVAFVIPKIDIGEEQFFVSFTLGPFQLTLWGTKCSS